MLFIAMYMYTTSPPSKCVVNSDGYHLTRVPNVLLIAMDLRFIGGPSKCVVNSELDLHPPPPLENVLS